MTLTVEIPPGLALAKLEEGLGEIADELNVDASIE